MNLMKQIEAFEQAVETEVKEVLSELGYNTDHGDITRISVAPVAEAPAVEEAPAPKKSKVKVEEPAAVEAPAAAVDEPVQE